MSEYNKLDQFISKNFNYPRMYSIKALAKVYDKKFDNYESKKVRNLIYEIVDFRNNCVSHSVSGVSIPKKQYIDLLRFFNNNIRKNFTACRALFNRTF